MPSPPLPSPAEVNIVLKRVEIDLVRQHDFRKVPELPPVENVDATSIARAREELMETAAAVMARNVEIEAAVDDSINYCKVQKKLGLWEALASKYHGEDPLCWDVWVDGLSCIDECVCPPHWYNRTKKDKLVQGVTSFQRSKVVESILKGEHRKPVWPDDHIAKVWDVSLSEAEVVPELGYPMLLGPYEVKCEEEIEYAFRRFPRPQKSKVRMIDPAIGANALSPLPKKVPIPTCYEILVNGAVAMRPEIAGERVVHHSAATIKSCRASEKRYEKQVLEYLEGNREAIDADLLKEGATHPKRTAEPLFSSNREAEAKRRKVAHERRVELEIVAVDVAKCYKNLIVKEEHRKYNRILVYDLKNKKYVWYESVTAIFGSRHSVTGWCRIGKCLRSIMRRMYGLNADDYVDDYTIFIPKGLGQQVVDAMVELLDQLGLPAMLEKTDFGVSLEVLGMKYDVSGDHPTLQVTEQKKQQILDFCTTALEKGEIDVVELDSFIGRLTFIFSSIADRAFNPVLRPLRRMLSVEESKIDVGVRQALVAIQEVMKLDIKRTVQTESASAANIMLYTDASWHNKKGILGAVLVIDGKFYAVSQGVKKEQMLGEYSSFPINFLETIAGIVGLKFFEKQLKKGRVDHAIDNDCAKEHLLAQGSGSHRKRWYLIQAASRYWIEATTMQVRPWIMRVPSKQNIADYPTRPEAMAVLLKLYPNLFVEIHDSFKMDSFLEGLLMSTVPSDVTALAQVMNGYSPMGNGDEEVDVDEVD